MTLQQALEMARRSMLTDLTDEIHDVNKYKTQARTAREGGLTRTSQFFESLAEAEQEHHDRLRRQMALINEELRGL
jgi:rubrerythrin